MILSKKSFILFKLLAILARVCIVSAVENKLAEKKALKFSLGFVYLVYNLTVCKLNKGKPKTSTFYILFSLSYFFIRNFQLNLNCQKESIYNKINTFSYKKVLFPLAAIFERILWRRERL